MSLANGIAATADESEIQTLRAEYRMLEKKLAERRLLMERVWEEKMEEDERIRREERDALEADIAGQNRVEVAKGELSVILDQIEADEAAALAASRPPLLLMPKLEPSEHERKMAKMRSREAAKGLRC